MLEEKFQFSGREDSREDEERSDVYVQDTSKNNTRQRDLKKQPKKLRVKTPKIAFQKSKPGSSPSMRASNIRKSIFNALSQFE